MILAVSLLIPALIHCPKPETIAYQTIPSSIHGYYYAISDDTGFGALSLGYFDPEKLEFLGAEISEINDYWRIYCSYKQGGTVLSLSSNVEDEYADCHFPDGEQTCEEELESCAIICPTSANATDDSRTQSKRSNIEQTSRFTKDPLQR